MAESGTGDAIRKVTMPKWGLSMTSGKITEWLVDEGAEVTKGMDLAEIDTDKIAGELEASDEGVLRRIVAEAGRDVPVGATIALVAPADVPDDDLDAAVAAAQESLEAGVDEEAAGPETGSVEVDGRSIAYAGMGDGEEVVVLVHGFGGDKNSWLFVQEPLAAERTVYALDLPGHGTSTKEVGDGSLALLAGVVTGFLEAKGIERAHLVGHSLGGAVVVEVAAVAPDRVASLTLVAPAGFGTEANAGYLRGFASASSRRELKPHLGALFADESLVTRQLADDLMKYKRLDGVQASLDTLLGTLLDGDAPALSLGERLGAVSVPVVVVWGAQDAVLPPSGADAVPSDADVRTVDGAGHMVHMEEPGAVTDAVVDAVQSAAGSPS